MRIAAIFRVSTERQQEGASLDAQQRRYRELAARQGWVTIGEFRGCESATQAIGERHVLRQVLECIRQDTVDALWVCEMSRLTRADELESMLLFRELRERGVKIIVDSTVRDLGSIDERFLVGIEALVARAEADRIKERIRRGKREKARQGRKNSGISPYGYRNPPPGDPKRGILQVVPEQAAIIRRVFDLSASGASHRAISKLLNDEQVPPPKGSRWGKSTIMSLLRNQVYVGTIWSNVWVKREGVRGVRFEPDNPDAIVIENAHEPIIDRALWNRVRARLPVPRTRIPRMLTGFLWINGIRYGGSKRNGKAIYCGRGTGTNGCPSMPAELTDDRVWDAFAALTSGPELVQAMMEEAKKRRPTSVIESEIKRCQARIEKLQARMERLIDMRADGEISKETHQKKSAETKEGLVQAEAELRQLRAELGMTSRSQAEQVVEAVRTLMNGQTKLSCTQRRKMLHSIVRRIDVRIEHVDKPMPRHNGQFVRGSVKQCRIQEVSFTLSVPLAGDRRHSLDTSSQHRGHRRRPRARSAKRAHSRSASPEAPSMPPIVHQTQFGHSGMMTFHTQVRGAIARKFQESASAIDTFWIEV